MDIFGTFHLVLFLLWVLKVQNGPKNESANLLQTSGHQGGAAILSYYLFCGYSLYTLVVVIRCAQPETRTCQILMLYHIVQWVFSRLNTLCKPLVWMRIAAVGTLYTQSEYVIHSMMSWNLTSKKSSTPMEYGVWMLVSCIFTYQSQKNPFP